MELTPEQINTFISNAVLESTIGKCVQDAVTRSVAELSKSYNNPFDHVIKQQVALLIEKEVKTIYQPQLEAGIREAMSKYMTQDVVSNIVKTAVEKLGRSNY